MPRSLYTLLPVGLLSLSLLLGHAAPLAACDVPVCTYALLHWPRQEYTLYYIHDANPAAVAATELLNKAAAGGAGHANLRFTSLDASLAPQSLTPEARYVLKANAGLPRPGYVLVSPKGRTIFSGQLSAEDVRSLLASSKTAALAEMLCGGTRGVLLVLTDSDEAQSKAALQTAQGVIDAMKGAGVRMGRLDVSRQDPAELWLVRQLLGVESDLAAIRGPMVFGAYGRCHVTEPYLGKGITTANLTALAKFMNGPCTCDIKAADLGVDLISDWDWDARVPGAGPPPRPAEPGGYMTFDE